MQRIIEELKAAFILLDDCTESANRQRISDAKGRVSFAIGKLDEGQKGASAPAKPKTPAKPKKKGGAKP